MFTHVVSRRELVESQAMSSNVAEAIDRTGWAPGPWDAEPDRVEFTHRGRPCLMVRHPELGHWCGYVAVPPGHPWHGKCNDAIDAQVHRGLTYSGARSGVICHTPKSGEPDNVWWFGFECSHAGDKCPRADAAVRKAYANKRGIKPFSEFKWQVYCDMAYVRGEVEWLAEQIADARNC